MKERVFGMFPRDSIQPVHTLVQLLEIVRAQCEPDAPAISFYEGEKRTTVLSYREYLDRIAAWSDYLQTEGVTSGDRVATLLMNRLDVPVLYLAAMCIGAVVVPLNPNYSVAEMHHVLGETEPVMVVTDLATGGGRVADLARRCDRVVMLDDVSLTPPNALSHVAVRGDDPAIILYTSGTTSFPKGVVQMHRNLVANAWSMVKALEIDHPVQYSVMPFYHAHAVGFGMMTSLLSSGHLVISGRMDPLAWPRVIAAEGATVTSMVPSMLQLLLRTRVKHASVPTLAYVFVSAAPLPGVLAREFEAQSGIPIAHAWGLSEYTNFATALPASLPAGTRSALMFDHETPCVGCELDGVQVEVVCSDGSEAEPGEQGELRVKGPSVTMGYYRQPDVTESVFRGDWVYTGDQGYYEMLSNRKYFFISGRIKDIIIRSGENISPLAVEAAIVASLPELAERIVVLGYPDEIYGEEIGLIVETSDMSALQDPLRTVIRAMPVRVRPKVVLWGEHVISRTHTGKTQRRMLVCHFEEHSGPGSAGTFARIGVPRPVLTQRRVLG